jgi:hypothetical protein
MAKPLKYFGEEMVAFPGEDGKVNVLNAYCAHMGAHLGGGGKVKPRPGLPDRRPPEVGIGNGVGEQTRGAGTGRPRAASQGG